MVSWAAWSHKSCKTILEMGVAIYVKLLGLANGCYAQVVSATDLSGLVSPDFSLGEEIVSLNRRWWNCFQNSSPSQKKFSDSSLPLRNPFHNLLARDLCILPPNPCELCRISRRGQWQWHWALPGVLTVLEFVTSQVAERVPFYLHHQRKTTEQLTFLFAHIFHTAVFTPCCCWPPSSKTQWPLRPP